jgi:hypothetical protein
MTWDDHPNLRLRPHAPARGHGRLQVQIKRAFVAAGVDTLPASVVYN